MSAVDVITYSGEINRQGYASLCEVLRKKNAENALLFLATPGGDPHAGFRIARALQHTYGSFEAVIPGACKSAGTLVVVGANKLYMDDMSELGPLDIQVKKSDEVIGRNSGLDVLQAVSYLQTNAMSAFRSYLLELTSQAGLSTRVASDIASRLTTGLYEPVFAQVDPMRLAEMQRAMEIAFAYGRLLNERSNNLRPDGLEKLVTGYPAHAFVIDRKEAKSIFVAVEKPEGNLLNICQGLYSTMQKNQFSASPEVGFYAFKGDQDADSVSQSAPANQPSSDGCPQGNGQIDSSSADPAEDVSTSCGGVPASGNA